MNGLSNLTDGIFAIEDDPHQLELLKWTIEALPTPVPLSTSTDGACALTQLQQVSPQQFRTSVALVLLDLRLPRMHGLDVLAHAQRLGLTVQVPFVVLTSSDSSTERAQALQLGAREFLVKPLGLRALRQLLLPLFERWIAPRLPMSHATPG